MYRRRTSRDVPTTSLDEYVSDSGPRGVNMVDGPGAGRRGREYRTRRRTFRRRRQGQGTPRDEISPSKKELFYDEFQSPTYREEPRKDRDLTRCSGPTPYTYTHIRT